MHGRPRIHRRIVLPIMLGVSSLLWGVADAAKKEKEKAGIIVRAPYWLRAGEVIKEMPEAFGVSRARPGEAGAISVGWDDHASIGRFADKDRPFDVLIYNALPNPSQRKMLCRQFPTGKVQPERFFVGQRRLVVITNGANSVEKISLRRMQELLRKEGKGTKWQTLGEGATAIKCYGEGKRSWCRDTIRRQCMAFTEKFDWGSRSGWYPYRDDFEECFGADEVIKKVREDRNAIGFFLYRGKPIKGVKILAIGKTDMGPFVKPKLGPYVQEDYPLSEPLILYLHPKAPPLAKKFCEFAVGPEGAKIAAKHGLITPWHQKQAEAAERLKLMKAGKGVPIRGVGSMGGSAVMRDLAVEYVKAKEVVQMACRSATTELTAVGYFVHSKDRELLVLDGPISEKAKKLHGKKWDFLEPETHVLATGRGIAICVNSMNSLKAGDWRLETVGTDNGRAFDRQPPAYGLKDRMSPLRTLEFSTHAA